MPYRLIAFDFDGTLADSFAYFLDTIDTLADHHGFVRIDRSRLDELRTLDARQLLSHVGLPLWKAPRVAAHYKRLMQEQAPRIPLFPGIAAVLEQLHAHGIALAVLTSNSEENVRAVLGAQARFFSHFSCGVSLLGKGDKLKRLLRRARCIPAQALYVGDELRDLQAARQAGIRFASVSWGYTDPGTLSSHGADHVLEHPMDMAALAAHPG